MTNSTELDIAEELEDFLYTPYGVGTLAAISVFLTSLLWCLGCCVYCVVQRRRNRNQEGVLEADRELDYYQYGAQNATATATDGGEGVSGPNGTLSSGYNTAVTTYSLDSLAGTNVMFTRSAESIIDKETS